MSSNAVRVFIRTRPTTKFADPNIKLDEEKGDITITIPKKDEQGYINHQQEHWAFKFDKILRNVSQEVLFGMTCKDLVSSSLDGYSGTLIAYGQTGAGKTFTILGSLTDFKYRGLLPRTISALYQEIGNRYEKLITVRVSYIEIYNENLHDLLNKSSSHELNTNLAIQEDPKLGVYVKGASMPECRTEEEALAMLFEGETNRTISEHKLNKTSSRSHCLFTVHLETRSRVESSEKVNMSKINLVDLAGSERTKKTGIEGQTVMEASFINKSLACLGQVVVALSEKDREHIPYRQSKLTYLLKDSIGGNCKTMMIATVWPEESHLEESISTLRFAQRMMKVQNELSVNIQLDPEILLKKYERQIKDLKMELAMYATLSGRGHISYEPYTQAEQYQLQQVALEFLNGKTEDIDINSIRQVKEFFIIFRNLYRNVARQIDDEHKVGAPGLQTASIDNKKVQKAVVNEKDGVGIEEKKFGFGIGKAPKESKPTFPMDSSFVGKKDEQQKEEKIKASQDSTIQNKDGSPLQPDYFEAYGGQNMDKNELFELFKENEGVEFVESIKKTVEDLKAHKLEYKQANTELSRVKEQHDLLKHRFDNLQKGKKDDALDDKMIEEEENSLIKNLKDVKREHKALAEKVKLLKQTILDEEQGIKIKKKALVSKFEELLKTKFNISLDSNHRAGDFHDGGLSGTDSHNDPEADKFHKARQDFMLLQKAKTMNRKGLA